MNLNEPRKKNRRKKRLGDRQQSQPPPLPVNTNENGEWRVYTAHLSACGTCIVDPGEMDAVYTMGFFGKGSLSRSYPSFGKRHPGAPPVARNRQWIKRRRWLDELQLLNDEATLEVRPESDEQTDNVKVKGDDSIEDPCGRQATSVDREIANDRTEKVSVQSSEDKGESRDEDSLGKIAGDVDDDRGNSTEMNKQESSSKAKDVNVSPTDVPTHLQLQIADGKEIKTAISITTKESRDISDSIEESDSCARTIERKHESRDSTEKIDKTLEPCTKKTKLDVDGSPRTDEDNGKVAVEKEKENLIVSASNVSDEFYRKDEVLLDSTEDEDVCEIFEKDQDNYVNKHLSLQDDIYVLDSAKSDKMIDSHSEEEEEGLEEEEDPYEVLVLPDTESETENYLSDVKPRIEKQGFPVNETLHLTFEETFFLMYGLGCLQLINYDGSIIGINDAWKHFELQDKSFVQRYVVYHYFRSKGWVVKPGLKYGGDFLLYKQGPAFYHASYIVIIEVMDADTLIRDEGRSLRKMTWTNLMGLERLSETIAKEILFAQILWPSSLSKNVASITVESLSDLTVRELLWRRWDPKQRQEVVSLEEENNDADVDELDSV